MNEDILFTQQKQLGIITLNRPKALNALSLAMINALQEQLIIWERDETVKAVVIRAAPGKAFCAGGDVRWLYSMAKNPEQSAFFWHEYRLNHFIHQYSKPYIALMDGITMGGGVGISLHGSHPVATEQFIFAMPETGIGFFPDIGASYLLARCPGKLGLYAGLTGNRANQQEALSAGLVKHAIPADSLPSVMEALLARDLSQDAHQRVTDCLQQFDRVQEPSCEERARIDHYFSADSMEGIFSALRNSADPWALSLLDSLRQKSPLSLKISFAQINQAKSLSLADCLRMDYRLVRHFMQNSDFYEGVRALLIDKDNAPRWEFKSLEEVTAVKVNQYFQLEYGELEPFFIN